MKHPILSLFLFVASYAVLETHHDYICFRHSERTAMRFTKYSLKINVDEKNRTFTGEEGILLEALDEPLFLNAVDLEIDYVQVNGKEVEFDIIPEEERVKIKGVYDGGINIKAGFKGKIQDVLMGLYLSRTDSGNFFTTQFESTGARRVFPCMDNPEFKAEFDLTLEIPAELDAISNMPAASTDVSGERKTVVFQTTPRMSTYLLYIGVGKLEEKSEKFHDLELILAAPKGHMGEVDLPFQLARESVENYEEYFGIKYVLPKMHLISVPDFGAGAMENWGAITFREVLLNVSSSTSALVRRTIAEVIAHEIAHQWFGNLVTMKWWNDLWLNESFATFMAYKTVDKYHKDWDMWGLFLLSETAGALGGDALRGSHPIDVNVKSPDEVAQIFDEISYGKGASILRMIESFVGRDVFRNGIREYLKAHEYGNAIGNELWGAIASLSEHPVKEIMEAWIKKQGYPVVHAKKEGSEIHLRQQRFLLSGEETEDLWPIPLTVKRGDKTESILFSRREMNIEAEGFIKLNPDQAGFYRVDYSGDLFSSLTASKEELTGLDKWGVASDLYAFLCAGRLSLNDYLDRITDLVSDPDPIVAESLSTHLTTLSLVLPDNKMVREISDRFFVTQLNNLGEKKAGEPDRISILRGTLSGAYSVISKDYADTLSKRFSSYETEDPDLRPAISAGYAVSRNDLEGMTQMLKKVKSDEDRIKIISAMGWLKGSENLQGIMNLIDDGTIRKQDMLRFFISVAQNPEGRKFLLENYEKVTEEMMRYFVGTGVTGMVLESTLPYVGLIDYVKTREITRKLRHPETEKGIEKGLEVLEIYSRLVKKAS